MKKGFIVTISTLMLLLPVFVIMSSYLDFSKSVGESYVESNIANKIAFYHDDISRDYFKLLDVTGEDLNFTHFGRIGKSYDFTNYTDFLSGFGLINNVELALDNYSYGFNISSYNTKIVFDDELYVFCSPVEEIFATFTVNNSKSIMTLNSTPSDNGAVHVYVSILDNNGEELLDTNDAYLDGNALNNEFRVRFNDSSDLTVGFGRVNGTESVLYTETDKITANISNFALVYNETKDYNLVGNGVVVINSDGVNKSRRVEIK